MPRKNVLLPVKVLSNVDLETNATSHAIPIQWLDNVSVQVNVTGDGSSQGTLEVQGSLDYAQNEAGEATNMGLWVTLTLNPTPSITGNTDQILINMSQLSFPWIRVNYATASSGGANCSLDAYVSAKGI